MGALVLLPPLPPEPEPVAVRGQCQASAPGRTKSYPWQKGIKPTEPFRFLGITFLVREVVPRPKAPKSDGRAARFSGQWQYAISPKARSPRKHGDTPLKRREQREMKKDVEALTAAGVYDERPRYGNGIAGDCPKGPCGWVSCRHSLLIHIRRTGSVKRTWPDLDVDQVQETCSLRLAAKQAPKDDPMPFSEIGAHMNMTAQRVEQINAVAERKFVEAWIQMYPDDPPPRFSKG